MPHCLPASRAGAVDLTIVPVWPRAASANVESTTSRAEYIRQCGEGEERRLGRYFARTSPTISFTEFIVALASTRARAAPSLKTEST
jgi:hypothetical protein